MEEKLSDMEIDKRCPDCGKQAYYNDKYDAVFCADENKWLESKCSDTKCEYCKNRPNKPL